MISWTAPKIPMALLFCLSPFLSGVVPVTCCRMLSPAQPPMRTLPSFTIPKPKRVTFQANYRRSANYHPTIWDPKYIESLSTPYNYEVYGTTLDKLKEETRKLLKSSPDTSSLLKLIDAMQRLGVAYHFEEEISNSINELVHEDVIVMGDGDLYTSSLQFRLLREHGFSINSDALDRFRNERGKFIESLGGDVVGLLSLYEASHLGFQAEDNLEEAKNFSIKHLKLLAGKLEGYLAGQVQRSLETPLHWRMPRLEARESIDVYSMDAARSSVLLELAKLDYNLVQSVYQQELRELARWWRDLGFKEKLSFSRDRLMENYLWAMGMVFEPQFSICRIGITKFVCIFSAVDDMYDIYGSLEELQLFTDAVNGWSIEAMANLPEYMRPCYLAMFNFGNEMADDVMKNHGFDAMPYIRDEWAKLCESYLVEARWFYGGYVPTLEEYLGNAWRSVGGHGMLIHAFLLLGLPTASTFSQCLELGSEAIYWSSLILRLSDDLGTSEAEMMRGDVMKSIQCYMAEENASEERARNHIKGLISQSWKRLNEACLKNSPLSRPTINLSLNLARAAQSIFQDGDGIGTSTGATKNSLNSLIITPVPIIS